MHVLDRYQHHDLDIKASSDLFVPVRSLQEKTLLMGTDGTLRQAFPSSP